VKLYDMIYEIDNSFEGLHFEKIEGFSCVGDVRSNALIHPIQYKAITNVRPGDDDVFEGIGWSPSEAVRNLLKTLNEVFK